MTQEWPAGNRLLASWSRVAGLRIPWAADEVPMPRLQRTGSARNVRKMMVLAASAWLITSLPHVLRHKPVQLLSMYAWLALYFFFGILLVLFFRTRTGTLASLAVTVVQSVVALVLVSHDTHDGYQAILLVIVAVQLGSDFRPVLGVPWVLLQTVVFAMLLTRVESLPNALLTAAAYLTFQMFALFATHLAVGEAQARQALARANAELSAATQLLEATSRTGERLRIARDLHDLIGHHLTALSLNLEVVSHLREGAARDQQIDTAKRLTKLLLNDVRDVVSRMRDEAPLDLQEALRPLTEAVQRPVIELDIPPNFTVSDAAVSLTALRCVQEIVTNTVRHSGAQRLRIRVRLDEHTLCIDSRDDGHGIDLVRPGNGLRGMRERVEALRGTLLLESEPGKGFSVHLRIPLQGEGR
ncbi:MAG TPA: sensor histidine kinase [Thermoanaerobaculia bacterium]|nr:sensor histidine kinase [Thermoanaerobaculia bacterium]